MSSKEYTEVFMRLCEVDGLTRLQKLVKVKELGKSGFNSWLQEVLTVKDAITLSNIVELGTYKSAIAYLGMTYEECHKVVLRCYEKLSDIRPDGEGNYAQEVAYEFLVTLTLGGDQLSILNSLQKYDSGYFSHLVSKSRVKPNVREKGLKYLGCESIQEIADKFGVTEHSARNTVAKLYKGVQYSAGLYPFESKMAHFLEGVEMLDGRGKNIILTRRCKSLEEVWDLLKTPGNGIGVGTQGNIKRWLREEMLCPTRSTEIF